MRSVFGLYSLLLTVCLHTTITVSAAAPDAIEVPSNWESALYLDHPLVGRIWSSRTNSFVEISELGNALNSSRYLLLGEKHDNPDHHKLQQNILAYLLGAEKVASLSLEMLDSTADERLAAIGGQQFNSLEELKTYLEWDEEGWDWPFYGPLISAAASAGIKLLSANISNEQMSAVYSQPLDESIAAVLDQAAVQQLNAEIDASHCNLLPESQFPSMVRVQQARDHQMASSLTAMGLSASTQIRVLVAGNYHVRRDLSVPNYVQSLDKTVTPDQIVSVAIMEVTPGEDTPGAYMEAYSATAPYDFIWFTPAISNEDYCASLQQ